MKSAILVFFLLFVPMLVGAQDPEGLVSCSGADCNFCTFMQMVNALISWLFTILVLVAVMLIVYAGFKLVVSGGDPGAMSAAKSMLTNVVIGFVIVLSAWLIVDTMIKALVGSSSGFGMWNQLDGGCSGNNSGGLNRQNAPGPGPSPR